MLVFSYACTLIIFYCLKRIDFFFEFFNFFRRGCRQYILWTLNLIVQFCDSGISFSILAFIDRLCYVELMCAAAILLEIFI